MLRDHLTLTRHESAPDAVRVAERDQPDALHERDARVGALQQPHRLLARLHTHRAADQTAALQLTACTANTYSTKRCIHEKMHETGLADRVHRRMISKLLPFP